ncbi:MAG: type I-D CRISPR-associated helicase Cas3' [Isosphaeraceae bacterium]
MDCRTIHIAPRAARVENGLHPFQRQVLDALDDGSARIIRAKAPVGSGKSRVIRDLLEQPNNGRMLVLTYPTKILMDAQVGALRSELVERGREVSVWPDPDRVFRPGAINLINYSTDSLLTLLRGMGPEAKLGKRGDLLQSLFDAQQFWGHERAVVTTPDVLHLIAERKYEASKRIQQYLNAGGLFVFDEFHLYHNLANFVPLLEEILTQWNGRIVLLSATPVESQELRGLFGRFPNATINFEPDSVGTHGAAGHRTFNHPLEVRLESFQTTDLEEWVRRLEDLLPILPRPAAVILDSVHRLQWLGRRLAPFARQLGLELLQWSGLHKDHATLGDRTVILGTSAIEVGIDMRFRSLVMEATYWPSAIQRLGRVGRFDEGTVVILSRRVFEPYLDGRAIWERTAFEQEVLRQVLLEPSDAMIGGEMFRGDSYAFALIDSESGRPCYYDQTIFALFDIDDEIEHWRLLSLKEKGDVLSEWGVGPDAAEEILLRDRLFPFWGLLLGSLRVKYQRIEYCRESEDGVYISAGRQYCFERK